MAKQIWQFIKSRFEEYKLQKKTVQIKTNFMVKCTRQYVPWIVHLKNFS